MSLALLGVFFLAACDPVETIYIAHPDDVPVLCEFGEETTYEVLFPVTDSDDAEEVMYEERHRSTVDPHGGSLSTNPDRVSAAILRGSLDSGRVPWIQFHVYCGDATDPSFVTPKITRGDLTRMGQDEYLYLVE